MTPLNLKYIFLTVWFITTFADTFLSPPHLQPTHRNPDDLDIWIDDRVAEEDEGLFLESECDHTPLFGEPKSNQETKRILSLALELACQDYDTPLVKSKRIKESGAMREARQLYSWIRGESIIDYDDDDDSDPCADVSERREQDEDYLFDLFTYRKNPRPLSIMKKILISALSRV